MKIARVRKFRSDFEMNKLKGTFADLGPEYTLSPAHHSCAYVDDQGTLQLCVLRKQVPMDVSMCIHHNLCNASITSNTQRGAAAGPVDMKQFPLGYKKSNVYTAVSSNPKHVIANRNNRVRSGTVGVVRRLASLSAFARRNPTNMRNVKKSMMFLSSMIKRVFPTMYAKQLQALRANSRRRVDAWGRSCIFNSVAVNRNFRTGVHFDKDMADTYGVMLVGGDDQHVGGELLFPQLNIAVDMRVGDLIIFNSRAWHANAKIRTKKPDEHPRFSYVMYATV